LDRICRRNFRQDLQDEQDFGYLVYLLSCRKRNRSYCALTGLFRFIVWFPQGVALGYDMAPFQGLPILAVW